MYSKTGANGPWGHGQFDFYHGGDVWDGGFFPIKDMKSNINL